MYFQIKKAKITILTNHEVHRCLHRILMGFCFFSLYHRYTAFIPANPKRDQFVRYPNSALEKQGGGLVFSQRKHVQGYFGLKKSTPSSRATTTCPELEPQSSGKRILTARKTFLFYLKRYDYNLI